MFVTERFHLPEETKQTLKQLPVRWGFGEFSRAVYFRTYSRQREDGSQEQWADTVIRVVEGVVSIRKDWYKKMGVPWDEKKWSSIAQRMAEAMFHMRFLPPGRGLWAMGTEYIFERGSAALNNCAYVEITDNLPAAASWSMDMLMCGVGVGFGTREAGALNPARMAQDTYHIPDTREGWAESLRRLLENPLTEFDYSQIRPAGALIRGFGGVASGPDPLKLLHQRIKSYQQQFVSSQNTTRFIADVFNAVGACVVAGNVRRSAELATGSIHDSTFLNLKNYELNPERQEIGWMSNNSVVLAEPHDFTHLPDIADLIRTNGEPGVINLMNVQKYGRFKEKKVDYAVGFNPCVAGETRILTREGYVPIEELVGQYVSVWDGSRWTWVNPSITGSDQEMVKVSLSDGTSLRTTKYHKFHVTYDYHQKEPYVVEARNLKEGTKLWKYAMPVVLFGEAVEPELAYTQGVFAGDGHLDDKGANVWLYGEKQSLPVVTSRPLTPYTKQDRSHAKVVVPVVDKRFVPFDWDVDARLAWFAGLIDTDGTLLKDGQIQIGSVSKEFLLDTRLMLTTLGVQAKVGLMHEAGIKAMPDGNGGLEDYYCQDCYRLMLNASDVEFLSKIGIGEYLHRIDVSNVSPNRDARRFVTVVSVEDDGVEETVYCFENMFNHTGTFEGIVTGQCAEIPLESCELCNLVEVFPTRCADVHEIYDAMWLATIYASTVSLLPSHREETNAVVARNRRIGVSISGIADWLDASNVADLTTVLRWGYEQIVEPTNRLLATQAGVPASVRLTTVKPSGTISQLAGVSPGMHWPIHRHYIRRMRVSENSPVTERLIAAGVPHEPDVYSENTLVFEFPQSAGKGQTRSVSDVSIWEQAAMVAFLQREWADNAVSNTLTFRKEEERDLEKVLSMYAPQIKSMSMLPDAEDSYEQMPYQRITREEYRERLSKINEVDWQTFGGSDGQDSRFCDGDSCTVDFVTAD